MKKGGREFSFFLRFILTTFILTSILPALTFAGEYASNSFVIEVDNNESNRIEIDGGEENVIEIEDEKPQVIEIEDDKAHVIEIEDDESDDRMEMDGEEAGLIEEEPGRGRWADADYDHLTVGTPTPFDGRFFTQMWGNAVSDLDVRALIHGYNLVEWQNEKGGFGLDPSVVSGITVTDNAAGDRTYYLTIYGDLTYCDGTPITTKDYAFSLLLSVSPQVEEIGGSLKQADYLLGYQDYYDGTRPYLAGVRMLSDTMMSITIDHNYLPFFYELALLDCVPYPISEIAPGCQVQDDGNGIYIANAQAEESSLQEGEEENSSLQESVTEDGEEIEATRFTANLLAKTILDPETGYMSHPKVTSGPYVLVSYDGEKAEFERNPYYKGNSDGMLPTISLLTYTTVPTDELVEKLKDGEVGLVNKCVSAWAVQAGVTLASGGQDFSMNAYTRNGLAFISFCCEREPLNNRRIRQAIAYCLDKDALVQDYVSNYGLRVDGYFGIGQWMYQLMNGTLAFPVDPPEEETDAQAQQEYEDTLAAWEKLSLDDLKIYDLDVEAARRLLDGEGWIWNETGEPYNPASDTVRCKPQNGKFVPLDFTMAVPEGNQVVDYLQEDFADHLAQAGIRLTVKVLPMDEILRLYYRQKDRDCDLIYLATNFDTVFDPSAAFRPDQPQEKKEDTPILDADSNQWTGQNPYNTTGLQDQDLYDLAVAMRQTQPGDTLAYCQKWVAFQERFTDLMPMIPIYSNVYFDFYPRILHDYEISSSLSWGQAIVGAYLSDAEDEEAKEEDTIEINNDNAIEIDDDNAIEIED